MLLSSAWFEVIAAVLLTILIFVTSHRPAWWFWTATSHEASGKSVKILLPRFTRFERNIYTYN